MVGFTNWRRQKSTNYFIRLITMRKLNTIIACLVYHVDAIDYTQSKEYKFIL